jgi:hypothetical protein
MDTASFFEMLEAIRQTCLHVAISTAAIAEILTHAYICC